jgi:thiol-disulfide isomerase/thioredoxin
MRSLVVAAMTLLVAGAPARGETPEKALCLVCAAGGETEPEKVAATREYRGMVYYFCSKKCAEAFDANPGAYAFEAGAAPAASWTTLAGEPLSLASLRGKVVLVDFWATWCKPCVKSMPELDAMYRDYQKLGLVVVGVSVDQGDEREKKVRKFLGKNPVSYPIAVDAAENSSWEAFQVAVLPTLYLIGREGVVLERWSGVVDLAAVRSAVDREVGFQAK